MNESLRNLKPFSVLIIIRVCFILACVLVLIYAVPVMPTMQLNLYNSVCTEEITYMLRNEY